MDDLLKKMRERYEADRRAEQERLEEEQNRERMLDELDKTNFEIEANKKNRIGCGTLIIAPVVVVAIGVWLDFSDAAMGFFMFITLGVLLVGHFVQDFEKSRLESRKEELERNLLD